jgi:C-terminal processing protease CtpA/Prc
MAGLRVGDKIFEWDGLPLSTVPIDDIPEFVEDTEGHTVSVVFQR